MRLFFFWVNSSFVAKPIGHQNTMLRTMQIFVFTHEVMRGWEPRRVRTNHKSAVLVSKTTLQPERCSWKPSRPFPPPTQRKWNPEWFSFIYVCFLSRLTIEDRSVSFFGLKGACNKWKPLPNSKIYTSAVQLSVVRERPHLWEHA